MRPPAPGVRRFRLGESGYTLRHDLTERAKYIDIHEDSEEITVPFMSPYDREPGVRPDRPASVFDRQITKSPQAKRAQALANARRILAEAGVKADIVPHTPDWRPGDVIVVEYAPGKPYTYVRGVETWPVDKGRTPKTDDEINRLYANGQVRPVLQSGGLPFPANRMP
jgi:hypothetical protein